MPRTMNQFVIDVAHNNKLYTIQQIIDFISKTGEGQDDKVKAIADQSLLMADQIMKSYGLTVYSIVNKTTPGGNALANLLLKHCEQVIMIKK